MRIYSFICDQISLNSRCTAVLSYSVGCHLIPDKATVTVNVQQPHGVWDVKQRFTATFLYKKIVLLLALSSAFARVINFRAKVFEILSFGKAPETFRAHKAIAKSRAFNTITELFYSHILNMNRGSLHFSPFRHR